jgi:hypothetical protein
MCSPRSSWSVMRPWVAAGAGRVDRLARFLDGRGGLIAEGYLNRPNPADIGWLRRLRARDSPQEVLDEALVHAAQNERANAVAWLLERERPGDAGVAAVGDFLRSLGSRPAVWGA